MKKVIWAILIILIIVAIGVGGWFLWDSLQKEKNKTAELENRLEKVESLKDFNVENGNNTQTGAPVESIIYANDSLGTFFLSLIFFIHAPKVMMFKYSSTKIKIPNIQVVINVLFWVLQYLSNFPANPNVPLDFLSNAIKLPNKPHTINTH